MKKLTLLSILFFALSSVIFLNSCSKDEDEESTEEFIADDNTFSGFTGWTLHTTKNGADPALKGAHSGDTSASTREVYFKDNQNPVNGIYPVGTVISKHTKVAGNTAMITAMVKRGNGFDPTGNDWEYFVLAENGSILVDNGNAMRGAGLMNGMCKGCHVNASSKDFVFSK